MAHYAWSNIQYAEERGKQDQVIGYKTVKFGEKVDAKMLGVSDDEFQAMVADGSIREMAPPEIPAGSTDSPVQVMMRQLRVAEGSLSGSSLAPGVVEQLTAIQKDQDKEQKAASS